MAQSADKLEQAINKVAVKEQAQLVAKELELCRSQLTTLRLVEEVVVT